jgi:phospholipase A1
MITRHPGRQGLAQLALLPLLAAVGSCWAQSAATPLPASPLATSDLTWQQCQRLDGNKNARLACFDRWAQQQTLPAASVPIAPPVLASTQPDDKQPKPVDASLPATRVVTVGNEGCRDSQYSELSRFWELETGTDCGTFGFRVYRPINVSVSAANSTPGVPTSPSPDHTGTAIAYQSNEMRIGMSVRTKLAQGLLTQNSPNLKDSVWFAYSQQSTWQVFNGALSRPFRTTDHEPELIYVYPLDLSLPGGWRWRYTGVGLVHQSNGQSLPYSRSWNRVYLMGGVELDNRFRLTARVWDRLKENPDSDDNPDITSYLGRAEFAGAWDFDSKNTFGVTVRNTLKSAGRGSVKFEWLKAIGDPERSKLRLHTQLFHGYGDTLIDYNRRRTVLSVGLSLVDF